MVKKLTAVVVGAGWSAEGHTKAFQHYGVEVLAICARKPDIVKKVADGLGVADASIDWRKSLLEHKPDIVAVTTPAILRTEVIELAVELGCHIICEKPLALTAEAAKHIYNLIKDTDLKHAFAATHLYDPSVAYIRDLITKQNVIGELTAVDIGYTRRIQRPSSSSDMVKPWNWMSSLAHGGGALNNGLTHRLGMLERMTGMVATSAVGEAKIYPHKAPVVPEIRDFRVWRSKMITREEAQNYEWQQCDAEWDYSAFFKLRKPNSEDANSILATMRTHPGVPSHKPTGGWFFYGREGTLVGRGGHILSPITKHIGEEIEELSVPQNFTDDLPRIGEEIQNKWTALVRDFLADIQGQPHEPYLTLHDGYRYQIAIDAIRGSKGWAEMCD